MGPKWTLLVSCVILSVGLFAMQSSAHTTIALVQGQAQPVGLAIDNSGTLYWVTWGSGQLLRLPRGGSSPSVLLTGLSNPQGVGVDADGNVYFSEYVRGTVSMLRAGATTPEVLVSGLTFPNYLAVNAGGDVFVIEGETCGDRLTKFDRLNGTVTTLRTAPSPRDTNRGFGGVAVAASGDVYYTTCGIGTVERLPPGTATPDVLLSGWAWTNGIAVDGQGNVYFTDYYQSVSVLAPGTTTPVTLATEGASRNLVAVDQERNVYYSDNIGGVIWKVSSVLLVTQTVTEPPRTVTVTQPPITNTVTVTAPIPPVTTTLTLTGETTRTVTQTVASAPPAALVSDTGLLYVSLGLAVLGVAIGVGLRARRP